MIPNLFTGEPSWLIIPCLVLAAVYSVVLYYREKKSDFSAILKTVLASVRFIAVFLIAFLLLAPFIKTITREKEKPVIVIAADNSASVILNSDSGYYRQRWPLDLDDLAERLSGVAEIRKFAFSNELSTTGNESDFQSMIDFAGRETDISNALTRLGSQYTHLNVGALILASDGIYNAGANPLYQAKNWPYPIYTIALGDTAARMDLIVSRVNFNRMVFLNNKFPLEVVVRGIDAAGKRTRLSVLQDGEVISAEDVEVNEQDFTKTFNFVLEAKQSGLRKFSISLDPVDGELSIQNNRKDIFIEVLDAKSKVLMLAAAPHPDISALKQAITANLNYEVELYLAKDFTGSPENYSMVILHQIPSLFEPADAILSSVRDKQIPALFILGQQTDFARFNQLNSGLKITTSPRAMFDESVPFISQGFTAFSLNADTRAWLSDLPPLIVPLGDYQAGNAARILLKQRIGSVETSRPMIMFNETLDGRTGVIAGEGLWKWRIYDFAKNKDHACFNDLVNKTIQFLSLREQKKNFRIYHPTDFRETESLIFDAEVYDKNFDLTTEPDVEMEIINEEGRQFPFVFNKSGNAFHLDAGSFPPGNYQYQAKVTNGPDYLTANGRFSVSAINIEAVQTVADHNLLYQLASGHQGKMYFPSQLDALVNDITAREDIRPVTYARKRFEELLNSGWLLLAIITLLSLEWFLRKRAGSY